MQRNNRSSFLFSHLRQNNNCSHGKELPQRLQDEVLRRRGVPRSLPAQQPHGQGLKPSIFFWRKLLCEREITWTKVSCYIYQASLTYRRLQVLTKEIYGKLRGKSTPSGFTVDDVIQTGVDNPGEYPYQHNSITVWEKPKHPDIIMSQVSLSTPSECPTCTVDSSNQQELPEFSTSHLFSRSSLYYDCGLCCWWWGVVWGLQGSVGPRHLRPSWWIQAYWQAQDRPELREPEGETFM